jgi:hypothetical protein
MKNGVSSVAAAIVAQHVGVGVFVGQIVGNFAFSAISILEINYDIHRKHNYLSLAVARTRRNHSVLLPLAQENNQTLDEFKHRTIRTGS